VTTGIPSSGIAIDIGVVNRVCGFCATSHIGVHGRRHIAGAGVRLGKLFTIALPKVVQCKLILTLHYHMGCSATIPKRQGEHFLCAI
jgi:hypothetical protein